MPKGDNVIPLRSGQDSADGDLPLPIGELAETVAAIGHCLSQIASMAESGQDSGALTLLHMAAVEQHLEDQACITVVTWPDVSWALRFGDARVRALATIRQSATWLDSTQSSTSPAGILSHSGPLSRTLREVRDLIVQRYPQTRQAS
jgi:hypothetical protein